MLNIRGYLRKVREELKEYEESLSKEEMDAFVEKCKTPFYYGTGNYDDRHLAQVYILRYGLAYGFQFSRMYSAILRDMKETEKINVTSIGCGTNIDYWGLTYAIEILNKIDCKVDYTGIDPVEWPHRIIGQKEGFRPKDTTRNNTVNNNGVAYNDVSNFRRFLDVGAKLGKNRELSDVYFFPHSIKEVCINSVPDGKLEVNGTYNTYQSMAEFAGQVAENLKDKPVYLAFSYRSRPQHDDEEMLKDGDGNGYAVYDMRYGTYLVSCLRSRGLEVELLEPAQETLKNSKVAFETIEEKDSFTRDFFDYPQCKCYTGNPNAPESDEKTKMTAYGDDGKCTFSSIFLDTNKDYTIVTREEWAEKYPDLWPLKKTENMCFQVFRVRKASVAEKENYALACSNYQNKIDYQAKQLQNELKDFVIKYNDKEMISPYLEKLKEFIEGKENPKVVKYIPTSNFIRNWMIKDGYVEKKTYENANRSEATDYGEKTGLLMEDFISEEGTNLKRIMMSPFFCETLLANITSGKYLNYQLFLKNSLTQEQTEQFPYQAEMYVNEGKTGSKEVSHFVDVVTAMGLSADYTITKKDIAHMLVQCKIFEYIKEKKKYRVTELGQKMGFLAREIGERTCWVANEEAQRFLVSLLAPNEKKKN